MAYQALSHYNNQTKTESKPQAYNRKLASDVDNIKFKNINCRAELH